MNAHRECFPLQWYDVHLPNFPFPDRLAGRIQAGSRVEADTLAREQHGATAVASLSIKPKRRGRQFARDLGDLRGKP